VAQQRQNEQNDKDIKKDLGYAGRSKSDSRKTKNCRHQCHHEKDQSPAQHKLNPPVHQGRAQTRTRQFPREVKIQLQAFWGTQPTQSYTEDHLLSLEVKCVVGKNNKTQGFWRSGGGLVRYCRNNISHYDMNLRKLKGGMAD